MHQSYWNIGLELWLNEGFAWPVTSFMELHCFIINKLDPDPNQNPHTPCVVINFNFIMEVMVLGGLPMMKHNILKMEENDIKWTR